MLVLSAIVIITVSGCNYKERAQQSDTDYGSREANDPKMIGGRAYGSMSNNPNQHNNAFFEYSSFISRKVSSLNGVSTAIVMLTDKNAYVSLMLDQTAAGTRNPSSRKNKTGSSADRRKDLVYPYNFNFFVNDDLDLSSELKQTVALLVREQAPTVQEIHVSARKEFFDYMNEFAIEAWGGRSLSPWLDRFNTVVQYFFAGGTALPQPLDTTDLTSPSDSQFGA